MFRNVKEPLRCPVCPYPANRLGERWIHQEASAYCHDCDFTYYWHSEEGSPFKAVKGNPHLKVKCGCPLHRED